MSKKKKKQSYNVVKGLDINKLREEIVANKLKKQQVQQPKKEVVQPKVQPKVEVKQPKVEVKNPLVQALQQQPKKVSLYQKGQRISFLIDGKITYGVIIEVRFIKATKKFLYQCINSRLPYEPYYIYEDKVLSFHNRKGIVND